MTVGAPSGVVAKAVGPPSGRFGTSGWGPRKVPGSSPLRSGSHARSTVMGGESPPALAVVCF
jgi:hypothetical protein